MAVRFYLPNDIDAPIAPAYDSSWEITGEAVRRSMFPYRQETVADVFPGASESSASVSDVLIMQMISEPLPAQTISGTVQGVIAVFESNAAADFRSQLVVRVVSNDGSTVRGTLLASNTTSLSNEWPSGSFTARMFPKGATSPAAISSLAISDDDRLVVEFGYRAHNTSTTTRTGTLDLHDADGHDHDASETGSGGNSWIEFSNLTLNAQHEFSDSIASATDVLPADGGTNWVHNTDFGSFTTETDDPDEIDTYTVSGNTDFTGWVKLVADADCKVRLAATGTSITSNPYLLFVYDEVPTSSSVAIASITDDFSNSHPPIVVELTNGTTYYVCITPYDAEFWDSANEDESVQLRVERNDAAGTLQDVIADATSDRFPSAMGDETLTDTDTFWAFTQEADDPTEILDYNVGDPYTATGWMKLVVPEDASVSITMVPPTDEDDGFLNAWLYDEVPTSTSTAIYFDDGSDPTYGWFYLPELALTTGTYYLGVGFYSPLFVENVTIKVRWEMEASAFDFSLDAVIKRTVAPGDVYTESIPTVVASSTATVDSGSSLTIPVPEGALPGDLLVCAVVVDQLGTAFFGSGIGAPGWVPPWTNLGPNGTADESMYSSWIIWDGLHESVRWDLSPSPTAAAGAMVAIRNGIGVDQAVTIAQEFGAPYTNVGTAPVYIFSDEGVGYTFLMLGFMGSSSSGTVTWTDSSIGTPPDDGDATEITQDSAASNASIYAQWRVSKYRSDMAGLRGAPSATQPLNLATAMRVRGLGTTQFGLRSFIAFNFALSAVIQAAAHTTHLRTGPHVDQTPSDYIVLSAALSGSLLTGDTLTEALIELDQRISDLES